MKLAVKGFLFLSALAAARPPAIPPDVPADVSREIMNRGCRIRTKGPADIIRGEFYKAGQIDWAVLCLTKKSGTLLVFPNSSPEQVTLIETRMRPFSKWTISTAPKGRLVAFVSAWRKTPVFEIDHDGINSSAEFGDPTAKCFYCFSAESSTFHHREDEWQTLLTIDAN